MSGLLLAVTVEHKHNDERRIEEGLGVLRKVLQKWSRNLPSVSEPATELAGVLETAPLARSYRAEPNW
jgi:hypothetical protein